MDNDNGFDTLRYIDHVSEEDVKLIVTRYGYEEQHIEKYVVTNASKTMLGFMADYWKLKVIVADKRDKKFLSFFIKAVSKTNEAKANLLKEFNLFDRELTFYTVIKNCLELPGLQPWSPKLVTTIEDALVFEDLDALQYKLRNKFERFDKGHTLQALSALSRFHASSIIFEEKRSKELNRSYCITEDYGQFLYEGGYHNTSNWFIQCKKAAIECIRTYSKYSKNEDLMKKIEARWDQIWSTAIELSDLSSKYRSVICHRDLWNNNILFHYKVINDICQPDGCVLVDFQGVKCQPPAGDIMLLLYCNLDPKFREENMILFLDYYHNELEIVLRSNGIAIDNIVTKEQFFASVEEQRLWGIISCACLIQLFWVDNDLTTSIFSDTFKFNEILSEDKASFVKKMMETNLNYRENVMDVFEEIVERYCL